MKRVYVIVLLLQPCLAHAYGMVDANGVARTSIGAGVMVFITFLGILLAPLALNWLARAAWKALAKTVPPFDIFSVSAIFVAMLLGLVGVLVVPSFKALFDSFGADLPLLTRLLVSNRFLLMFPGALLLVMLYVLRHNRRRETYFGAILAGEILLLLVCVVSLYMPVFDYGQAA